MSDPLKQFLNVQMAVARLIAQQTETLIKEGSVIVQHAVETAGSMHDTGISFLRDVMEKNQSEDSGDKSANPALDDVNTQKLPKSDSNSFERDRRVFSD